MSLKNTIKQAILKTQTNLHSIDIELLSTNISNEVERKSIECSAMTTIRVSKDTKKRLESMKKLEELRVSSDTYPDTSTRPSMEAVIKKLLNKEK